MAKEALQEILDAETSARELIQDAKKQAKDVLSQGRVAYAEEARGLVNEAREKAQAMASAVEADARKRLDGHPKAATLRSPDDDSTKMESIAGMVVERVLHYGDR